MNKMMNNRKNKAQTTTMTVRSILASRRGDAYVDTGVKILIGVVLGVLLLGGLYTLFNDNILPNIESAVTDLFNYKGIVDGMGGV